LEDVEPVLSKIESILHARRNVDFSHYKRNTIRRRILRRMILHRLRDLDEYLRLLKENKDEVNALYQDLLITVTNFFREPAIYQALTKKFFPPFTRIAK